VLHYAASKGKDEVVELFIQRGADVHLRDRWGRNALQDAIDNGHQAVVARLAAQVTAHGRPACAFGCGHGLLTWTRKYPGFVQCCGAGAQGRVLDV
jgi:hypothetical protein